MYVPLGLFQRNVIMKLFAKVTLGLMYIIAYKFWCEPNYIYAPCLQFFIRVFVCVGNMGTVFMHLYMWMCVPYTAENREGCTMSFSDWGGYPSVYMQVLLVDK